MTSARHKSTRMTFATSTTLIQRPAFARAVAARRNSSSVRSNARRAIAMAASFYDLKAKTLDGDEFDFAQLKGKVTLITNVASR